MGTVRWPYRRSFLRELRHAFRRYHWRSQWRDILQHLGLWPSGHEYEWGRIRRREARQKKRECEQERYRERRVIIGLTHPGLCPMLDSSRRPAQLHTVYQRQTCKVCGRPDKFNFQVPDDVWEAVIPPEYRNLVVCLGCFDDFASVRRVNYATRLTEPLLFVGDAATFEFRASRALPF